MSFVILLDFTWRELVQFLEAILHCFCITGHDFIFLACAWRCRLILGMTLALLLGFSQCNARLYRTRGARALLEILAQGTQTRFKTSGYVGMRDVPCMDALSDCLRVVLQ